MNRRTFCLLYRVSPDPPSQRNHRLAIHVFMSLTRHAVFSTIRPISFHQFTDSTKGMRSLACRMSTEQNKSIARHEVRRVDSVLAGKWDPLAHEYLMNTSKTRFSRLRGRNRRRRRSKGVRGIKRENPTPACHGLAFGTLPASEEIEELGWSRI